MRPISNHLDRTSLVNKGFIMWVSRKIFSGDMVGSLERTRSLNLAHSGSQSQHAIWFILPTHGASHIIKSTYCPTNTHYNAPVFPSHGWTPPPFAFYRALQNIMDSVFAYLEDWFGPHQLSFQIPVS